METDPTTIMPDGSTDLTQIPDMSSMMDSILGPTMWLSLALSLVFLFLYFNSLRRRRKVEQAVLDMQKILNEMNERDKTRSTPPSLLPKRSDDRIIALEQPEKTQSI